MSPDVIQGDIKVFIEGIPYCQNKVRGRLDGASIWTQSVNYSDKGPIESYF